MKSITCILFVIVSLTSCRADEVKKDQVRDIQTKTRQIVTLIKQDKPTEVAKRILDAKESGVKRHAASIESVKNFFDGIDVDKIEFGPSSFDAERQVFVVRVVAPRNIQLEYSVDPDTGGPGKLQSIHP
jgi:hypothetical protein